MERQSCSKEGILETKRAQKDDCNKGTAELSLIKAGMRCRQQGAKWDDLVSQKEKTHTISTKDIMPFIFYLAVTWMCWIINAINALIDVHTFTWNLKCVSPLIFTWAHLVNLILSPPTAQGLSILIIQADHNRFGSCLAMRSVWLSSTEKQRDYAESGESLRTVGVEETTNKMLVWTHSTAKRTQRISFAVNILNDCPHTAEKNILFTHLSLASLAQYQTV